MSTKNYDVVIVGGGPAGLSAALILVRSRRRVLLCDAGAPRNQAAVGVHNFVTRDGISPTAFRAAAREDLGKYVENDGTPRATFAAQRVVDIVADADVGKLVVELEDGTRVRARRAILTVGVVDEAPNIPGLREVWGRSAFQCPYCHGYESRERPWGVLAESDAMAEHAALFTAWTDRLTVFTNGKPVSADILARLERAGLTIATAPIERIVPTDDPSTLDRVELRDGSSHACNALLVRPSQGPTPLVARMKLELDDMGYVKVNEKKESSMPDVYVAGDATTMMQTAMMAAGAGMLAATHANMSLTFETLGHTALPSHAPAR